MEDRADPVGPDTDLTDDDAESVLRSFSRRGALAGLGAIGVGAVGLGAGARGSDADADADADAATAAGSALPVLAPDADWAATLARTPAVQLQPSATYRLADPVALPNNCLIVGNGATVTVSNAAMTAFTVPMRTNVTVSDVHFRGQATNPVNGTSDFGHVAIRSTRSTDVRITGCTFTNWRGAGVVMTGSASDDYISYRCKIQDNTFFRCFMGVSITDRAEYGQLIGNSFASCRLAIWNSSGNWAVVGNLVVACYGAFYAIGATSPYGSLSTDNWAHGSLVGNTFNHATTGTESGSWQINAAFPIGGVRRDPGSGIVVENVLPPTFSGNTLWASDVKAVNLRGTRWLLSGSTLSTLTITCAGTVPIHVVGTQASGVSTQPKLVGNVKDLLPG